MDTNLSNTKASARDNHGVDDSPTLLVRNVAAGETLRFGQGVEHF